MRQLISQLMHRSPNYLPIFLIAIFALSILGWGEDKINRDGVGYIIDANLINMGVVDSDQYLNHDRFFPSVLALIHKVTGMSFYVSSLAFNFLCLLLTSYSFLGILRLVSQKKWLSWVGALTIMVSVPLMDSYLTMTLRDHGMWAATLISMYMLIMFTQSHKKLYLFISLLSIILATLFRSECYVFLIIPLCLIMNNFYSRQKIKFNRVGVITILGSVLILITILIGVGLFFDLKQNYLYSRFTGLAAQLFQGMDLSTNQIWLKGHLEDYPVGIKLSILSFVFIKKWAVGLGIPTLFFVYLGFKSNLVQQKIKTILLFFLCISAALVLGNLLATFSITVRYFMLHYLVLYIFMALGLYNFLLLQPPRSIYLKLIGFLMIACLIIQGIGNVYDTPHQNEEKMAAEWLIGKNIGVDQAYVGDLRIRYYLNQLNRPEHTLEQVINTDQQRYQYLVVNKTEMDKVIKLAHYYPIHFLPNDKEPKIIIFSVKDLQ